MKRFRRICHGHAIMTYTLLIVESPAKCKKIEGYLGAGYKCIASFGHICELNGLGSIDVANNFRPTFSSIESKRQQISRIRKAIAGADEVMLAADDDREGEAIAWHVCQTFSLPVPTTKRIIFHEITKPALQKAVREATVLNMDLVHAAQARQILDLLVGFKISPILWQKISQKTKQGLSAGRCQTPALRLIYDNQKDIDASPGRKVYNTVGYFTKESLPFMLNFNHDGEDIMSTFLEESVNHDHVYSCSKPRSTTKNPPKPFTTSALQQTASNELRISPKDTMKACQKLYEEGLITYMRTDSTTYSKEFIGKASKFIDKTYGKDYVRADIDSLSERNDEKKKKKKGKKEESTAQEAHEAIRPTDITRLEADKSLGGRECRLYKLIRRNTLESCMSPASYTAVTATITAPEDHEYRYSAEQAVFPGWKVVAGYEEVSKDYHFLLTLKKGSVIPYNKIVSKVSMKDLKSHYTEAKLVQLLEQNGIGRPSTFSSLVDKIQERGYVKRDNVKGKTLVCTDFELVDVELSENQSKREFGNEKNKLVIQPLGALVMEFLIKHFDTLFQYEYTKEMEDTLDHIAKGDRIWHDLCRECLNQIDTLSVGLAEEKKETIRIDAEHTYMIAKYGPVIKHTKGDKTTFKGVRSDIDLDKLRRGEYTLKEIIAPKTKQGKDLGKHNGNSVVLKNGRYGPYIEWNGTKKSVRVEKDFDEIELADVTPLLTETGHPSMMRVIDEHTSVRSGKYGDYVFHKKPGWKKPKFINLTTFQQANGAARTCDIDVLKQWLNETHDI